MIATHNKRLFFMPNVGMTLYAEFYQAFLSVNTAGDQTQDWLQVASFLGSFLKNEGRVRIRERAWEQGQGTNGHTAMTCAFSW